jgi:RNA-dependent RNA polymerase
MQVSVGRAHAKVELLNPLVRTVPSPVDPSKHYYEFNVLSANSVDFGTKDAATSMIAMYNVQARGEVRLTLDLDRKGLDIQFPLTMDGMIRNCRFRLPIALLSHIYKVAHHLSDQTALIIPFDSPPQFFIQRYEGEEMKNDRVHTSFSTKDKLWVDWNTWYRETDMIDTGLKRSLQEMPLMNHKGSAIIDIGKFL